MRFWSRFWRILLPKWEAKLPHLTPNAFNVQFPRVARGALHPCIKEVGETNDCWRNTKNTPSFAPTGVKYF